MTSPERVIHLTRVPLHWEQLEIRPTIPVPEANGRGNVSLVSSTPTDFLWCRHEWPIARHSMKA